jgi:type 1 fimbriae regulatory protein FimB/type 1 fimbriae regulatory protein FimE
MCASELAGFTFPIYPHMLRLSTGFYLANKGHDPCAIQAYLGYVNIQNTLIYTEMAPNRFNDFWKD